MATVFKDKSRRINLLIRSTHLTGRQMTNIKLPPRFEKKLSENQ
jgi:hypothetical protein